MDYLARALDAVADWRSAAGPAPSHPALTPDPERFEAAFAEFSTRMAGSYPFHHPRYAGQMLKPPHPVAIAAYTAAMHVNANNQALDAVEELCRSGRVGTVVVTAGTTGTGTVDRVERAVQLRERYGIRIHVDAAYGGFFTLLDELVPVASFKAIADCDRVVVDPHKHGLQPYGCGAVLFRDPGVGRLYKHDSPYTYFTSAELHLGEISLECSRAGASAAALWLTRSSTSSVTSRSRRRRRRSTPRAPACSTPG